MYRRILVPLEHTDYDDAIVAHVRELAKLCSASVVLIHVADGWAARNQHQLVLRESDGDEVRPRLHRGARPTRSRRRGSRRSACSPAAIPRREIAAAAEREHCDLVAMSTHGHRGIQDLLRGSVANEVRHHTTVPVLMVRGAPRHLRQA